MADLYENLLKATNNIDDITTEKYATVTKLNGNYCDAKEEDTGLEHTNVPIINGANLSVGDKVIIGFLNNSIYDVVCYGALDKTIHDNSKQDLLVSGQNIKTINHTSLLGSGNIEIQGGGSDVDIVTSWEPTPSDTKVPSEKLTINTLDTKVDKVTGKGLSTNDFTNSYKNTIDGLSTVATTGDYDDLSNKPSIPSSSSDLSDGSDLVKKSSTSGLIKNDGSIDTSSYLTSSSLSNYVQKSNTSGLLKNDGTVDTTSYLSSLPSHNHDDRYYTESEMDTALSNKISKSSTTGLVKNDGTIDTSTYLTSSALSGYQTTSNLVTSFSSTTSDSKYPSEKLTKTELDKKITKSNSATGLLKDDGTVMTSGTGASNWAVGNHTHTGMLTTSDIYDGLDSTATNKALSAKQGKALSDMIGSAITYIVGSGS